MTAFNPGFAKSLARLASDAYAPTPHGMSFGDAQLGHLGNVFQDDENVIVAYRGSRVPRGADTLPELLIAGDDWLGVNFQFGQTKALGGMVHRGFWERSERTWPDLLAWVRRNLNGRRLWVTGHSMGGALAILAGQRFAEVGIPPAGVYAFGAPMVGDEAFRDAYAAPLFCVEHRHDIIPHLPFGGRLLKWLPAPLKRGLSKFIVSDGYTAVGEIHWITPGGELVPYSGSTVESVLRGGLLMANRGSWVPDHWVEKHTGFLGRYPDS